MYGVAGLTKRFLCSITALFYFFFFSFALLLLSQRPCIFLFTISWPVNCTNLWGVRGMCIFLLHFTSIQCLCPSQLDFYFLKERHVKAIYLLSKEWGSYRLYLSKCIFTKKRSSLSHFHLLSSVCVLSLLALSSHLLSSAVILGVSSLCRLSKNTHWQSLQKFDLKDKVLQIP